MASRHLRHMRPSLPLVWKVTMSSQAITTLQEPCLARLTPLQAEWCAEQMVALIAAMLVAEFVCLPCTSLRVTDRLLGVG